MLYNTIKILHICSATLVLTSIAYCFHLWRSIQKSNDLYAIPSRIQTQTWLIIAPFAIVQLATGFTMISLQHYDYNQMWIIGSVISFIIVISCWFSFIYFLLIHQDAANSQEKNSQQLKFYRQVQGIFLFLCGIGVLSMIFFMTNKTSVL